MHILATYMYILKTRLMLILLERLAILLLHIDMLEGMQFLIQLVIKFN